MARRILSTAAVVVTGTLPWLQAGPAFGQLPPAPVFRSGVAVVRVAALVQDRDGRPVSGLAPEDFVLYDGGERRPIVEFRAETAPIGVAVLVDGSGSMGLGTKQERARDVVHHLLSWIEPGADEVALLRFDSALSIVQPFTTAPPLVTRQLGRLVAFGQTSLYDAVARASREVAGLRPLRQAIAVVTDGIDTSSRLDPAVVARVASTSDVPVYILAVERPASARPAARPVSGARASLGELARWTGGQMFVVDTPAAASIAARRIVTELRSHYLIGFEANDQAGWHTIAVRMRKAGLVVRARSGYAGGRHIGKLKEEGG
ncbi:MAG: VWA domain-containing protein [Acidobacteriota bacterium]